MLSNRAEVMASSVANFNILVAVIGSITEVVRNAVLYPSKYLGILSTYVHSTKVSSITN